MSERIRRLPLAAGLATAVLLSSCSPSGPDGTRAHRDEPALLPAQGAAIGAGVGAAIGCTTAFIGDKAEDCLKRAAIGGVVGAAAGAMGGLIVRDRADRYAIDEAGLQRRLEAADQEVARAREARAAAERVVARHEASLAELGQQAARGRASEADLRRAVARARTDGQEIRRAREELTQQVAGLEAELAEVERAGIAVPDELARRRDELRRERDRLDRQLEILLGAVDRAERVG